MRTWLLGAWMLLQLLPQDAMPAEHPPVMDTRLTQALARLQAGGTVKLAVIGGSITTGYAAQPPLERGWAPSVAKWLQQQAQRGGGRVEFTNLGVSGTDSAAAAQRVRAQAIDTGADIVIVEFGVNDQWLDRRVRTHSYEGLIRQLLKAPNAPAVVALELTQQGNQPRDAVEEQLRITRHYGLTAIDFGSWMQKRVARGDVRWESLYDEPVHPNQQGHEVIAAAVVETLSTAWREARTPRPAAQARELPAPLHSADFEFVQSFGDRNVDPYENRGFRAGGDVHEEWRRHPGGAREGWVSDQDGAVMSFLVHGRQIGLFHSESEHYRNLEAWVDDRPPVVVRAHNPMRQGYLGWAYTPVGVDLEDGAHLLHVRMRRDEFEGSKREAGVVSIMTAGLQPGASAFAVDPDGAEKLLHVKANDPRYAYVGRFDAELPEAPLAAWSGSEIRARFTGRTLGLRFGSATGPTFYSVTIDGQIHRLSLARDGTHDYVLAASLAPGEHEVSIAKRTEGAFSQARFMGLLMEPGAQLLQRPADRALRLEFYGDSITAGACNGDPEADQYEDLSSHDGTRAYGAVAARLLGADYVGIAVSGTGITQTWNDVLMPNVFDRVAPRADAPRANFSGRAPDVVVVNLGQNDFGFPQSQGKPFPADYTARYVAFVKRLRALYPKARIACVLGGMSGWRHSSELLQGFKAAVATLQRDDPAVWSYVFEAYTDNHPRIDTHELLAKELADFLRNKVLR